MDNLASVRGDTKAMREVVRYGHTWVMSLLYVGTFGSFIGYSFAFGLVLQNQFGRTPLQAAAVTFLGPLLGSLSRPIGGWLSDRIGGGRVTFATFGAMALATVVLVLASSADSLATFTAAFIVLFVLTGIGNGSTYKMIPAIFQVKARAAIQAGADEATELRNARRLSGALIGLAGAIGALGGLFINLAFRQSFAEAHSGVPAFVGFLVFYAVCVGVTWFGYLRKPHGACAGGVGRSGGLKCLQWWSPGTAWSRTGSWRHFARQTRRASGGSSSSVRRTVPLTTGSR